MYKLKIFIEDHLNVLLLFVVVLGFFLRLNGLCVPFIGRHGWNEALYASIVDDYLRNNRQYPYLAQFIRPDFNLGILFYLIESVSVYFFGNYEWAYRLPILLASLINVLLFYLIGMETFRKKTLSLILAFLYSTLPMTVYYGVRTQPEELLFLFYLISMFTLTKYISTNKNKYLYISSFMLGISSFLVKQTFMHFIFVIILLHLIITFKQKTKLKRALYVTLILSILFLIPLAVQLIILAYFAPQEFHPTIFYISRIIIGPLSRLVPSKAIQEKIYYEGINIQKIFQGIQLAFGYYFGIPVLILSALGLILLGRTKCMTAFKKINLLLNLTLGLVSLYIMKYHLVNHEYYFYIILYPLLVFATISIYKLSKTLLKFLKVKRRLLSLMLFLVIPSILLTSFSYSYIDYWQFHDGFANTSAIKAGEYIRVRTSEDEVIVVQSPVMGFYAKRPNLHWGYLWVMNKTFLEDVTLVDMITKRSSLLEWDTIYRTTNSSNIIKILEYWRPKILVISPDVSDALSQNKEILLPLIAYFSFLYRNNGTIDFYTIKMIKENVQRYELEKDIIVYLVDGKIVLLKKYTPLIEIRVFYDEQLTKEPLTHLLKTISKNEERIILLDEYEGLISMSCNKLTGEVSLCVESPQSFAKVIIRTLPLYERYTSTEVNNNIITMTLNLSPDNFKLLITGQYDKGLLPEPSAIVLKSNNGTLCMKINFQAG